LDEIDNAVYSGPTAGARANLLSAISDKENWAGVFAPGDLVISEIYWVEQYGAKQ
jgi:hypothetical protein